MSTKPLPSQARTANVSGNAHCRWCANSSFVAVRHQAHPFAEDMGPCPYCEKGALVEFGETGQKRWPKGFWEGRTAELEPLEAPLSHPLPPAENGKRLRELGKRLGALTGDV